MGLGGKRTNVGPGRNGDPRSEAPRIGIERIIALGCRGERPEFGDSASRISKRSGSREEERPALPAMLGQLLDQAQPPASDGYRWACAFVRQTRDALPRSEEHTSALQSLMRISYAVFCLKKKTSTKQE